MPVETKRIYDDPEPTDGTRILVDRLWPRGLSKEKAGFDLWMKDAAPSTALRKWFDHVPERPGAEQRRRARGARPGGVSQDTAFSAPRLPSMQRSSSA